MSLLRPNGPGIFFCCLHPGSRFGKTPKMYMRFVSPQRSRVRGVDLGIFHGAYYCRKDPECSPILREAIQREVDWFNDYLPVPRARVFEVKSRKRFIAVGICWFKCDAREMIRRAYTLQALLGECGYVVTRLRTERPGQILYADDYQVVAKPAEVTPTMWG